MARNLPSDIAEMTARVRTFLTRDYEAAHVVELLAGFTDDQVLALYLARFVIDDMGLRTLVAKSANGQ
jgi:hypothetical protein